MQEPTLAVGILTASKINFSLHGLFIVSQKRQEVTGDYEVLFHNGQFIFENENYTELILSPADSAAYFTLNEVVIGIGFHWERKEEQSFSGNLKLIVEADRLTAVNELPIESYLKSVISSEMSATASLELLKAHAVISRSWLLSQIEKKQNLLKENLTYCSDTRTNTEWVKWWDREDHTLYDVCADDHCQRYQGITRATTPLVEEAVESTRGELLMYDNTICDARFSKCCGGMMETFENCWEPSSHPYLQRVFDRAEDSLANTPDLIDEADSQRWIRTSPEAFCNTTDKKILSQVLNNYDQETTDFYRWRVEYSQEQLSDLLKRRTGVDFGEIIDLIPLNRGVSGRITRLKIEGTLQSLIIGKELLIRKSLSESHLYSSAFVVDKLVDEHQKTTHFTLIGAGWGHGVGLCQIGAAVMGEQGYSYRQILHHYYRNVSINRLY